MITGPNGTGKTSVLEAVAYLGTQRSFRGAPTEAMVRTGAEQAIVRAEIDIADSPALVEAEIVAHGPEPHPGQPQGRASAAATWRRRAPCTVFSPEDLAIVSGGPRGRRDLLDDTLALVDPEGARAADEVDRVLRQRAALLRQSGGRVTAGGRHHARRVGPAAGRRRQGPGGGPRAAGGGPWTRSWPAPTDAWPARGTASWWVSATGAAGTATCSRALEASRTDDLRRGVNTVGPHRDELDLGIDGPRGPHPRLPGGAALPGPGPAAGRPRAGRGRGPTLLPTLLLDDVFSELDPGPQPGPGGRAARRPVPADHGGAAARGHRGGPDPRRWTSWSTGERPRPAELT